MRWGKVALALATAFAFLTPPALADSKQPVMTIVVQTVRWSGSKEFSSSYLSGLYSMVRDQAVPFWSELLNGAVKFETADLTTAPVTMLGKLSCSPTADEVSRITSADKAMHIGTVVRVVLGDFDHCSWASSSNYGDVQTPSIHYIAAQTNVYVVQLERMLGHALALPNSSVTQCTPAGFTDRAFSSCKYTSYDIAYDLMGNVWDGIWKEVFSGARGRSDLLNIHNRWWLGQIAPGELHEVWTRDDFVDLQMSNQSSGVRGLYLNSGGSEYLLEYRRTYYGAKGVAVLRLGTPSKPSTRELSTALKPTDAPPSAVGGGSLLQKGDLFVNSASSLIVEVVSLDATSARLRVTRTDQPILERIADAQFAARQLQSGVNAVDVGNGQVPILKLEFLHPTGSVVFTRDRVTHGTPLTALPERPEWSDAGSSASFTRTVGNLAELATASKLAVTYADGSVSNLSFVSLENAAKPTPTAEPTPSPSPTAKRTLTITCVKGKNSKRVSGLNPKCPAGWRKK